MTYEQILEYFNLALKKAIQDFKVSFKEGDLEWSLVELIAVRQNLKELQNPDPETYELLMEIMEIMDDMSQQDIVERVRAFLHYMRLHAAK